MQQQTRRFEVGVAGVTFEDRQAILESLHGWQEEGMAPSAALAREPNNRYDPNAIMVLVLGEHVGYVPKALAAKLAPRMDAGEAVTAVAVRILRGGDPAKPGYGARVDVEIEESKEASL